MTLEELLNDLQALVDQYSDGTDPTEEDAARMAELTDQINERTAQTAQAAQAPPSRTPVPPSTQAAHSAWIPCRWHVPPTSLASPALHMT